MNRLIRTKQWILWAAAISALLLAAGCSGADDSGKQLVQILGGTNLVALQPVEGERVLQQLVTTRFKYKSGETGWQSDGLVA